VVWVLVDASTVVRSPTIVFAVLESEDVAMDWVLSVAETDTITAISVLAVRDSSGICPETPYLRKVTRII
jgi:hypothetical protein